jgi:hypothetical protein
LRKQFNVRPLVINRGGILEVIDCVWQINQDRI